LCCALAAQSTARAGTQTAFPPAPDRVVLDGVGKAHGLGMAMDGVEGQARAGWTHDRILDLFYPGTSPGRAGGAIRVGLGEGSVQRFVLPDGGIVTDAVGGRPASAGYPVTIPDGATFTVSAKDRHPVLSVGNRTAQSSAFSPFDDSLLDAITASGPLPTTPPVDAPAPPTTPPEPTPPPSAGPPSATPVSAEPGPVISIIPNGAPALTQVGATGRRYRGTIEVAYAGGTLRVVNRLDLESYVAGIAEERNAAWPLEGLKTLAVAARSLAAASMTWFGRSHDRGYDICPTQNCQLYLGFDGEEPNMRRAVAETAGQIRTYKGSAILAMYHGNGGGQTESYQRVARSTTDSHPYLKSIRYPYADPFTWRRDTTYSAIRSSLAAHGLRVPSRIDRVEILERGESPRVVLLRLSGEGASREMTGTTFAEALDLWSTWFTVSEHGLSPPLTLGSLSPLPRERLVSRPIEAPSHWPLVTFAVAFMALAIAATLAATGWRVTLRAAWPPLRAAPAPSRPAS
jgi:SpoIID/LytB domain protein